MSDTADHDLMGNSLRSSWRIVRSSVITAESIRGSVETPRFIRGVGDTWGRLSELRRDTGFLVFSFPRSLGSGVYDEINGGQRKLVRTYLSYISTKFRPIWMRFGARVSKTPCQTLYPWVSVWHGVLLTRAPNLIQIGRNLVEI